MENPWSWRRPVCWSLEQQRKPAFWSGAAKDQSNNQRKNSLWIQNASESWFFLLLARFLPSFSYSVSSHEGHPLLADFWPVYDPGYSSSKYCQCGYSVPRGVQFHDSPHCNAHSGDLHQPTGFDHQASQEDLRFSEGQSHKDSNLRHHYVNSDHRYNAGLLWSGQLLLDSFIHFIGRRWPADRSLQLNIYFLDTWGNHAPGYSPVQNGVLVPQAYVLFQLTPSYSQTHHAQVHQSQAIQKHQSIPDHFPHFCLPSIHNLWNQRGT